MGQVARALVSDLPGVSLLSAGPSGLEAAGHWGLEALKGRLAEVSADGPSCVLTAAVQLVLEAQREGEPVVWGTLVHSSFYPPDVADVGVDLNALVVLRADDVCSLLRAMVHVGRSGAFGLLVLDLEGEQRAPASALTQLVGHAQRHGMAVVFLTRKRRDTPSIGSLISVRAEVTSQRRLSGSRTSCRIELIKDKRNGPGWRQQVWCDEPAGLR